MPSLTNDQSHQILQMRIRTDEKIRGWMKSNARHATWEWEDPSGLRDTHEPILITWEDGCTTSIEPRDLD